MPILTQEKSIKEYHAEVREQYPDISPEEFERICKSPFEFIKSCIKLGKLPKIIVKYIGKFRVYPSKVKNELRKNEVFFEKQIIDEENYTTTKDFLTKYLKHLKPEKDELDSEDETDS